MEKAIPNLKLPLKQNVAAPKMKALRKSLEDNKITSITIYEKQNYP